MFIEKKNEPNKEAIEEARGIEVLERNRFSEQELLTLISVLLR